MSDDDAPKSIADYMIAFASIMIPIVLVYLGHIYKTSEATEGVHEKYVEMSIGILSQPATGKDRELRAWALEVLNEYSQVPLHDGAKAHLMDNQFTHTATEQKSDSP